MLALLDFFSLVGVEVFPVLFVLGVVVVEADPEIAGFSIEVQSHSI